MKKTIKMIVVFHESHMFMRKDFLGRRIIGRNEN